MKKESIKFWLRKYSQHLSETHQRQEMRRNNSSNLCWVHLLQLKNFIPISWDHMKNPFQENKQIQTIKEPLILLLWWHPNTHLIIPYQFKKELFENQVLMMIDRFPFSSTAHETQVKCQIFTIGFQSHWSTIQSQMRTSMIVFILLQVWKT